MTVRPDFQTWHKRFSSRTLLLKSGHWQSGKARVMHSELLEMYGELSEFCGEHGLDRVVPDYRIITRNAWFNDIKPVLDEITQELDRQFSKQLDYDVHIHPDRKPFKPSKAVWDYGIRSVLTEIALGVYNLAIKMNLPNDDAESILATEDTLRERIEAKFDELVKEIESAQKEHCDWIEREIRENISGSYVWEWVASADNVEKHPGVYILTDGSVQYIGTSGSLRRRLSASHPHLEHYMLIGACYVPDSNRNTFEMELINFFSPPLNKTIFSPTTSRDYNPNSHSIQLPKARKLFSNSCPTVIQLYEVDRDYVHWIANNIFDKADGEVCRKFLHELKVGW